MVFEWRHPKCKVLMDLPDMVDYGRSGNNWIWFLFYDSGGYVYKVELEVRGDWISATITDAKGHELYSRKLAVDRGPFWLQAISGDGVLLDYKETKARYQAEVNKAIQEV